MRIRCLGFLIVSAVSFWMVATRASAADLKVYDTKYYILHTDLGDDQVREASLRLELMVEEYLRRCKAFKGKLNQKLDLYIFRSEKDYHDAGGMPNSAGVYRRSGDKRSLMAYYRADYPEGTWKTVQHEGFHQFVDLVIGGDVPTWLNEGLAEYFEAGIFTGDGYELGAVGRGRVGRLRSYISNDSYVPFDEFLSMDHKTWNQSVVQGGASKNYLQAWSIVYFLVKGNNGKYSPKLTKYLQDLGKGDDPVDAWKKRFGSNIKSFEKKWREYWGTMPTDGYSEYYLKAKVRVMTNFLARSLAMGQTYRDADEFIRAARNGDVKIPDKQWLPLSLLEHHARDAYSTAKWTLRAKRGRGELIGYDDNGWSITGKFSYTRGKAGKIKLDVREGRKTDRRRRRR